MTVQQQDRRARATVPYPALGCVGPIAARSAPRWPRGASAGPVRP